MNNRSNQQRELQIDLKSVLWDLLTQWKAIVIVSLAMTLLICGAKYVNDKKTYDSRIVEQKEAAEQARLSVEERIAQAMDTVPEDERAAVEYLVNEQEWVDEQKQYLQDSILMQTDPTNQRVLKLIYDIEAENDEDVSLLVNSYETYIQSDAITEKIKPYISAGAEDKYIAELFYKNEEETSKSADDNNNRTLKINIVLLEETDAEAVAEAIATGLSEYTAGLQTGYAHSLSLVSKEVVHVYHKDNISFRSDMFYYVNSLEASIKSAQSSLSDEQKAALSAIVAIKREAVEAPDADTGSVDSTAAETIDKPGFNKKYAVFGFVLGILLYAFAYALRVLIQGRINSAKVLEHYTGSRLLGEVYCDRNSKGFAKLLHSRSVEKLRYHDKLDTDIQIEKTAKTLDAVCRHAGAKTLAFLDMTGPHTDSKVKEAVDSIILKAKDNNMSIRVVDASDGSDEKDFLDVDNAVLTVDRDIRAADLSKLMTLLADYDIRTLGSVYVAEK